jgi:hypothetical protein
MLTAAFDYGLQPFPIGKLLPDQRHIAALRTGLLGLKQLKLLEAYLARSALHEEVLALNAEQRRECADEIRSIDEDLQARGLTYSADSRAWRCFIGAGPLVFLLQTFTVYGFHGERLGWVFGPAAALIIILVHVYNNHVVATAAGKAALLHMQQQLARLRLAPTRSEFSLALAAFGWEALRGTELDQFATQQLTRESRSGEASIDGCSGGCGGGCGGD